MTARRPTMDTETFRAVMTAIHNGEVSGMDARRAARERGVPMTKAQASQAMNADYMAAVHRTFAPTMTPVDTEETA